MECRLARYATNTRPTKATWRATSPRRQTCCGRWKKQRRTCLAMRLFMVRLWRLETLASARQVSLSRYLQLAFSVGQKAFKSLTAALQLMQAFHFTLDSFFRVLRLCSLRACTSFAPCPWC